MASEVGMPVRMDTGGGGGMCVEVEELYETEQQWRPTNATGSHFCMLGYCLAGNTRMAYLHL